MEFLVAGLADLLELLVLVGQSLELVARELTDLHGQFFSLVADLFWQAEDSKVEVDVVLNPPVAQSVVVVVLGLSDLLKIQLMQS